MFFTAVTLIIGGLLGAAATTTTKEGHMLSRIRRTAFGSRRRKIATSVVGLALVAASVAAAAWLISNTGVGGGKIAQLSAPTFTQGTAVGTGCLPGGTCDSRIVVSNPNNVDLVVASVEDDGGGSGASFSGSGCPTNSVSVPTQSTVTPTITVPKNSTNVALTIPDAYKLDSNAPTACMGQTFGRGLKVTFATP